MPYKNIVFVKLEKRLFNDPRFYMLSEKAQLNYVKFMLFAAETYNRIPKNLSAIRKGFKTNQSNVAIENTIFEIRKVFPRFKENGEYYYFEDFESKTNYIRECPSIAEGTPKEVTDIDIDKEEDIDKEKEKKKTSRFAPPSLEELNSFIKESSYSVDAQQFIDFYQSKGWMVGKNKMKDWKAAVRTWQKRNIETGKTKGTSRVVEDYKKTREMLDKLNTPIIEIWKPELK